MKNDTPIDALKKLKDNLERERECLWISGWENYPELAHVKKAVHAYLVVCDIECKKAIEAIENVVNKP